MITSSIVAVFYSPFDEKLNLKISLKFSLVILKNLTYYQKSIIKADSLVLW